MRGKRSKNRSRAELENEAVRACYEATKGYSGLTDDDIASLLGVSPRTVWAWKKDPGLMRLDKFRMLEIIMESNGVYWRNHVPEA